MDPKSEDCYFYYYSTCSKGDACAFRHCPQALGCETVCTQWREGRCFRKDCMFRHMDIKVQRSETPCYWESQPGGCAKPHCVFMHTKRKGLGGGLTTKKNRTNPVAVVIPAPEEESGPNVSVVMGIQPEDRESIRTPQVAPVVVNPFDEESDADSSTGSPVKIPTPKKVKMTKMEPTRVHVKKESVLSRVGHDKVKTPDSGQEFEVKSLDEIQDEELRRVKEALAKADEYLSKTLDPDELPDDGFEDLREEFDEPKVEPVIDIPVSRRTIQLSSSHGVGQRRVEPQSETFGGGRRIILVDEDENNTKQSTSPRKAVNVMDRLGKNPLKDEPLHSRREVPNSGVRSRLGLKVSGDNIESGNQASSVKGRLGIVRRIQRDVDETDKRNDSRTRQGEPTLKSRLGLTRTTRRRSSDDENGQELGSKVVLKKPVSLSQRITLKRNTSEPKETNEGNLGIKSWEEIRRAKRSKLGLREDDEDDQTLSTKQPGSVRRRPVKEQQIYRPPSAKSETVEVVRSSVKSRIGSSGTSKGEPKVNRIWARERGATEPSIKSRIELKPKAEDRKKSEGWGVKTFSEIMREKQLQREATSKSASPSPEKNSASPPKQTFKRTITPITFDEEPTRREPPKKTKKFTPIVFDLEKGDSKSAAPEREEEVTAATAGGDDGLDSERRISPIVFSKSSADDDQGDPTATTASKKSTRAFSPISFTSTDGDPAEVPSKQKVTLEKLTIPQTRRRSSSGLVSPVVSPPFKSPTSKSLKLRSPVSKSPVTTPTNKSPLTTPTSTKLQGDDSFLHEMDYLLDEGDPIEEGTVDDIGEDDLLNEMEELLA